MSYVNVPYVGTTRPSASVGFSEGVNYEKGVVRGNNDAITKIYEYKLIAYGNNVPSKTRACFWSNSGTISSAGGWCWYSDVETNFDLVYKETTVSSGDITYKYGNGARLSTRSGRTGYWHGSVLVVPEKDYEYYAEIVVGTIDDGFDYLLQEMPATVPISYKPKNCVLQGPSEGEEGTSVSVLVTPGPGMIIKPSGILVYNKDGDITATYSNGVIQFDVPSSS